MDTFLAIPEEKQQRIIEAGYHCFGKSGYKKTSAQDIATQAGISKGMIFHYFGSKKGMYQFLIQRSFAEILEVFQQQLVFSAEDFFDKVLAIANCKIDCFHKHPSLLPFCTSVYLETDPAVAEETSAILAQGEEIRKTFLLADMDTSKFKDPSYAGLVWKLLMNYGESTAHSGTPLHSEALDALRDDFTRCVHMLKENLYKPEYL